MNKLEKFIYEYLKHHPSLKMRIRNFYMDLMDIIPDDPSTFDGKLICKEGFFFGFHDHSPFSDKDLYILSNKLEIPLRMPKITDHLSVGYWDSSISNYANIAKSYAWNYHKGCRLQWLNSKNLTFIFNNAVDNKLVSQIRDVFDTTHVTVDYPIDSTSPNGKLATSFSYERLEHLMPGYGYQYNDEAFLDDKSPTKTGLFIIDLEKNKRSLICSLNQLANLDINSTMERARHYVTHTLFSPNSKQIAFLHRWIHNDVAKRYSRLIMCNIDGTDIKIFPTNGMVSHFVWDEKNGILAYCRINNIDGHYLFKDSSLINYKGITLLSLKVERITIDCKLSVASISLTLSNINF